MDMTRSASNGQSSYAYSSWEQVSGYFDGDGTPILTLTMFTIVPSMDWADSYRQQLDAVRTFLISQGLRPTNCYPCGSFKPVWHLRIFERGGLLRAAMAMLPHLVKKRDQIQGVIDYMEDKTQGETLVEIFNDATRIGTRSGFLREVRMPYTHSEGVAHAYELTHSGKRVSDVLTKGTLADITERRKRGETLRDISFVYGVSRSAIRRAFLTDAQLSANKT